MAVWRGFTQQYYILSSVGFQAAMIWHATTCHCPVLTNTYKTPIVPTRTQAKEKKKGRCCYVFEIFEERMEA